MIESQPQPSPLWDLDAALPVIQDLTRLHDYVGVFDEAGRIMWLSDALAATTGRARSVKGQRWSEVLVADGNGARVAHLLESSGRVSNEPVALRGQEGQTVHATMSAAKLDGACGQVAIFRLQNPESLDERFRSTLNYMSAILDSAPEGVVVVDRSRFITYTNPALCEIMGFERSELLDKPAAAFLQPGGEMDRISLAVGGGNWSNELQVRRKDGSAVRVGITTRPLTLDDGTRVGTVAYVRDVTEQRRLEEELARKNAELEHYVQAASHDLRSPLVAVLGFTRLLREDFGEALGERGQHFVHRIEEAGRTMEVLVHDLLELSRIGRAEQHMGRVDPREVLLQLQAEVKPRLDETGVVLELPDDVPMMWCDRTHLYRVLANLVGNAIDHMGPTPMPRISVEIQEQRDFHCLVVGDNGCGIPADQHDRIFESFQSLGKGSRGHSGTGIGLAVVRRIAETHGGRAWVESQPGQGAAFFVTFPHE